MTTGEECTLYNSLLYNIRFQSPLSSFTHHSSLLTLLSSPPTSHLTRSHLTPQSSPLIPHPLTPHPFTPHPSLLTPSHLTLSHLTLSPLTPQLLTPPHLTPPHLTPHPSPLTPHRCSSDDADTHRVPTDGSGEDRVKGH